MYLRKSSNVHVPLSLLYIKAPMIVESLFTGSITNMRKGVEPGNMYTSALSAQEYM